MASIENHRTLLEHRLAAEGWTLGERRESELWSIADIWTIRSVWRPQDFELFLVFLVDPQAPSGVTPSAVAWAVAATSTVPRDNKCSWLALLQLGRRWERDVDAFFAALSTLRDAAATREQAPSRP